MHTLCKWNPIGIYLFVTGFLHLECLQGLSKHTCVGISFRLRLSNNLLFAYTVCFSVRRHLSCFHLLAAVNSAATNVDLQVSVRVSAFTSFVFVDRRAVAGPYGDSIFSCLKNLHIVFQNSSTIAPPRQQHTRVLISPCPHQHSLFSRFLFLLDKNIYRGGQM